MCFVTIILALGRYALTRLTKTGRRVWLFEGEDMAATKTRCAPTSEPMTTVADIDEALLHTSLAAKRNDQWRKWADALLDQRNVIARQGPVRERRVMYPSEYRDGQ